ncbi:MAG: TRAP transporter small permease [Firmicutes bacterium]|nr:TRAP transporter small permease [Bacillota bacterium]
MFERIDRFGALLDRVLVGIAVLGLSISTLCAFAAVVLRYGFRISFDEMDEICRYTIMSGAYLCAGPLLRSNGHVSLDVLSNRLKGKAKAIHRIICSVVAIVIAAMLVKWGIDLVQMMLKSGLRSASMLFPMWAVYSVVPIGMALLILFALLDIGKSLAILTGKASADNLETKSGEAQEAEALVKKAENAELEAEGEAR